MGSREVESEEESESSNEAVSSATEVSTDSEFACEECPAPSPPAILVTEAPPNAPPPPQEYPLSRARSAGGLATKRALELKRRYLLGESSPPAVRKSDSASQIDTKFEAFRSTITEFQKMLHPAPVSTIQPLKPIVSFQLSNDKKTQPMPDIIKNLCSDAPVDLLTKVHSPLCKDWRTETIKEEKKESKDEVESDSLSDNSSHTDTAPNKSVPRVEVHDEGGELIQLDSLTIINSSTEDNDERASGTATTTGPTVVAAESESSESGRDATTLALTETELSDWAAESAVLEDCGFGEDKKRNKNPRTLSGPKLIHDAKNIAAVASHVCGRVSPTEPVVYSNALDHFEFADEGDQDPSIETPITPKNQGYMELVDHDYTYSISNDRSMNFIEREITDTILKSASQVASLEQKPADEKHNNIDSFSELNSCGVMSSPFSKNIDKDNSESISDKQSEYSKNDMNVNMKLESLSLSEISPPLVKTERAESETTSPPLVPSLINNSNGKSYPLNMPMQLPGLHGSIRLYAPAICRSASETFNRCISRSTDSPNSPDYSIHLSSGSVSSASPIPKVDTVDKVREIKKEREEQTELVRRLVLERLGTAPRVNKKTTRRTRVSPACSGPPPVPPPPKLPEPPPPPAPPRPSPPVMPLPVTPSFSDPELARERRSKSIMKSISSYLNRRLSSRHKWFSEPDLTSHTHPHHQVNNSHKSTGALQEPPPVPPPPACYLPPTGSTSTSRLPGPSCADVDERDAMQLWFEARWARLVAQRCLREESSEPAARRVARLERRLTRPLSAEQQAATVAELVQVTAQREAHQALMAATRRRSAAGSGVGD